MNLTEASQRGAFHHTFVTNSCSLKSMREKGEAHLRKSEWLAGSRDERGISTMQSGGFVCTLLSSALQCKSSLLLSQREHLNE
jgi:hypothetical protein